MSDRPRFSGVYPILYTFYDAQGGIDEASMRLQVERCIAAGAHGIAVLGLVTEVHKLDVEERRQVVDVVGAAIAGRVPFAVTVGEPSIPGQIAFARHAQAAGAAWVILQPPAKGHAEAEYVRFLGRVADALDQEVLRERQPSCSRGTSIHPSPVSCRCVRYPASRRRVAALAKKPSI